MATIHSTAHTDAVKRRTEEHRIKADKALMMAEKNEREGKAGTAKFWMAQYEKEMAIVRHREWQGF